MEYTDGVSGAFAAAGRPSASLTDGMLTGACFCGDIGFEVPGDLIEIAHCHCSVCRKFHGGAFATFGAVDPKQFRWTRGEERIVHYRSSPHGVRHFCPRCG